MRLFSVLCLHGCCTFARMLLRDFCMHIVRLRELFVTFTLHLHLGGLSVQLSSIRNYLKGRSCNTPGNILHVFAEV